MYCSKTGPCQVSLLLNNELKSQATPVTTSRLKLVSSTVSQVNFTGLSTVARSESSQAPLQCGGTGHPCHMNVKLASLQKWYDAIMSTWSMESQREVSSKPWHAMPERTDLVLTALQVGYVPNQVFSLCIQVWENRQLKLTLYLQNVTTGPLP